MNKEAREAFLKFAKGPEAKWSANFRDLNAALTRMATLAPKGRITVECVEAEVARLQEGWREPMQKNELENSFYEIDPFDRVQLEFVIKTCRESKTLSDAGRKLFAVSRAKRSKMNDADRLKKYLKRFDLTWEKLQKAG
jgi:transcriptional regulatory protein RtcR